MELETKNRIGLIGLIIFGALLLFGSVGYAMRAHLGVLGGTDGRIHSALKADLSKMTPEQLAKYLAGLPVDAMTDQQKAQISQAMFERMHSFTDDERHDFFKAQGGGWGGRRGGPDGQTAAATQPAAPVDPVAEAAAQNMRQLFQSAMHQRLMDYVNDSMDQRDQILDNRIDRQQARQAQQAASGNPPNQDKMADRMAQHVGSSLANGNAEDRAAMAQMNVDLKNRKTQRGIAY